MTADEEPTEWGPDWLTKTRLAVGVAAVLAAAAVWVFNAGGRWQPISQAPGKADSALQLADSALEAIQNLQQRVGQTNRAVKILGCEGMELEPVAAAQLECSDLTSNAPDSLHSSRPAAMRRASPPGLGVFVQPARASEPKRRCLETVEEAASFVDAMSDGREPPLCVGADP